MDIEELTLYIIMVILIHNHLIVYPLSTLSYLHGFEAPDTRLKRKSYDKRKIDHVGHLMDIEELTLYTIPVVLNPNGPTKIVLKECLKTLLNVFKINLYNGKL